MSAAGPTPVRIVPKPWGHEVIWARTDLYVGKVLHIKAGHALSIQYHEKKDETIHVLSGKLIYRVGDRVQGAGDTELTAIDLREGESFRNTPGTVHQIEAITDCVLLEASTPHVDDVVRLKDRYGREGTSAP
jgi:mannose-6-phosphate isomerase